LNLEVKTVAQLLGQQPVLDEEKGIEVFLSKEDLDWSGYGVIIIDEFSMVNRENFKAIVNEVKNSLLFISSICGRFRPITPSKRKRTDCQHQQ